MRFKDLKKSLYTLQCDLGCSLSKSSDVVKYRENSSDRWSNG